MGAWPTGFIILYLAFVAKQMVCDFILQTAWMARGKERRSGWLKPMVAHIGVHALGTLAIVLPMAPELWYLAAVDFLAHGLIDRAKALLSRGLPMTDPRFWWLFGADQALHQLTHLVYLLMLLNA